MVFPLLAHLFGFPNSIRAQTRRSNAECCYNVAARIPKCNNLAFNGNRLNAPRRLARRTNRRNSRVLRRYFTAHLQINETLPALHLPLSLSLSFPFSLYLSFAPFPFLPLDYIFNKSTVPLARLSNLPSSSHSALFRRPSPILIPVRSSVGFRCTSSTSARKIL